MKTCDTGEYENNSPEHGCNREVKAATMEQTPGTPRENTTSTSVCQAAAAQPFLESCTVPKAWINYGTPQPLGGKVDGRYIGCADDGRIAFRLIVRSLLVDVSMYGRHLLSYSATQRYIIFTLGLSNPNRKSLVSKPLSFYAPKRRR